jgi:two-component sensor histidine kinase
VLLGAALGAAATAVRFATLRQFETDMHSVTVFPALILAAALGGFPGGVACLVVASLGVMFLVPHPGASLPWLFGAFWVSGGLAVIVTATLCDNVRQLRTSQARLTEARMQLRTVVSELAHRNRNALFVIKSIVSQSARGAPTAAAAERIINDRLDALVRAQDLVASSKGVSASLGALLATALEPFGAERFMITPGPEVVVDADIAAGLALLFHELATNALKYGALTRPEGKVEVSWILETDRALLRWREAGGPRVSPPTRKGFGSRLFDVALVPQGGKVECRYEPAGLDCELCVPMRRDDSNDGHIQLTHGAALVTAFAPDGGEAASALKP